MRETSEPEEERTEKKVYAYREIKSRVTEFDYGQNSFFPKWI